MSKFAKKIYEGIYLVLKRQGLAGWKILLRHENNKMTVKMSFFSEKYFLKKEDKDGKD